MILALDCGSTFHKAALFDERLARLAEAEVRLAYSARTPERVEIDPEKIWLDTIALIKKVCGAARIPTRAIKTVALASQAQTFTLLNSADEPMVPFLSWRDARASEESAALSQRFGDRFHAHCGFPAPLPQLQLPKLLWLARRLSKRQLSGARVISLPSFLALRLGGLHCIDTNLAAMGGLYSLATGAWWSEALTACGVNPRQCGSLVEMGTAVASRRRCPDLELASDLDLVFAGNDQTAGAYAAGADDGRPVLTLGTALVVYRFAGRNPGPFSPAGCWGPYPRGGYYELLARDEGCAVVQREAVELTGGDVPRFLELAASAAPGRAGYIPDQAGGAAAWSGSDLTADRSRAMLEGICFSLRGMTGRLDAAAPAGVTATGGGSANDFWLALLANILNTPVRRGAGNALLGAAMLARPGVRPPLADAVKIFHPEPALAAEYENYYAAWNRRAEPAMANA